MLAHRKLALALAASGSLALAACSDRPTTGPEASGQVVIGGINVVVTNLLNDVSVDINVSDNNVAVQVCAIVNLINAELLTVDALRCEISQRTTGKGKNAQMAGVNAQRAGVDAAGQVVVIGGLLQVVITNVLNDLSIDVDVRDNNVAVQVCALVEALSLEALTIDSLTCEIEQR